MSITAERKQQLIKEYAITENDTGSTQVQCAVITERINNLAAHLKDNHKDFSSRRGLLILVGRRKRFLEYLKKTDFSAYEGLIKRLGLRK